MNCVTWWLLLVGATVLCLSEATADDPTLVTLPEGIIRGHVLKTPKGNTYYAFQEIPYAAPPVGKLRFQAPKAPPRWDGVLNTTANTKICYQSGLYSKIEGVTQTEDCLYINVYTPVKPEDSSEAPLPVFVWIHGGGFENGAGVFQTNNPKFYIDRQLVVVAMNYRLGALGFLNTEDGVIPGNIGLKDQHLALEWVKNNIKLFGGDPDKITISGESAGGVSVGLQLVSKRNEGLFRAVILQSGTATCQWSHQDYARFYAFELGRSLNKNFNSDDSNELLKLLQSADVDAINGNNIPNDAGKEADLNGGLIWLPVIEDENLEDTFLTGPFHEDIRTGNINKVPILIGFNSEERITFMMGDNSSAKSLAEYLDKDESNLIANRYNMTKENKLTAGAKLKEVYIGDGTFKNNLGEVVKFYSDEAFSTPITRHAKLQSSYADVYLYQFSYKGKMGGLFDVEVAGVSGVGHAEEIPYMWDIQIFSPVDGPDDPQDLLTRERLLTMWTNFVKYLNPTPEKDNTLSNITWEKVSPNNLVYLNINDTLEMQKNPKKYIETERVIDIYAIKPLINY